MQSGKARVIYKVNKKGPVNIHKMDAGIKILKKLAERVQKEGMTKWLADAIARIEKRIKTYRHDTDSLKKQFGL